MTEKIVFSGQFTTRATNILRQINYGLEELKKAMPDEDIDEEDYRVHELGHKRLLKNGFRSRITAIVDEENDRYGMSLDVNNEDEKNLTVIQGLLVELGPMLMRGRRSTLSEGDMANAKMHLSHILRGKGFNKIADIPELVQFLGLDEMQD